MNCNEHESTKLNYLNSLEKSRDVKTDISDKPKYFITFPYPYMNGKLHLGHLYSISKADFMSYYKELQGFNVLFPLAFHCTGMPIAALAKKLGEELEGKKTDISTKEIIQNLGFNDVMPFTDPVHWIKTFPKLCISSLKTFGANIDWRRSFVTTDINKYYDSFVRWQFFNLKELGYLSFGKRHSIYCPLDKQMCLDHDRRKGENIKPVRQIMFKFHLHDKILLVRQNSIGKPYKLVCGKSLEVVSFKYNNTIFLAEKIIFDNLKYQINNVKYKESLVLSMDLKDGLTYDGTNIEVEVIEKNILVVKTDTKSDVELYEKEIKALNEIEETLFTLSTSSEGIVESVAKLSVENTKDLLVQTKHFISVYIPEKEVISRSGGICVVSLLDQWYIDYSNEKWKSKVKKCLDNLECGPDTRLMLYAGIDWVNKWGFSRSFGLGTKIPWDTQYLIDSLSDSTIYMAFYTVKHLLFEDLEGKLEIFPSNKLSNDVWDYIFAGKDLVPELYGYLDLLEKCRNNFQYFYPVDLRVSGKDLIKNHLLFFMFNHVALFDEKYWPKRIFTNGHLMLNKEKMSKSTGNFLSVDDALLKYGKSATRMCLAVCGDTNDDANFVEDNANLFILKIYTFVKEIQKLNELVRKKSENETIASYSNADVLLLETVSVNVTEALNAYNSMKYSDVVKFSFFEMVNLINLYNNINGTNILLKNLVYKSATQLLYPIMPDLCRTLIEKYFDSEFNLPEPKLKTNKMISAFEYISELIKKIAASKQAKNNSCVKIAVGKNYSEWKKEIFELIDKIDCPRNNEIKKNKVFIASLLDSVKPILQKSKINITKGNNFVMDYLVNPDKFVMKFNEYEIINEFKFYIENMSNKKAILEEHCDAEPLNPIITFSK